MPDNPYKFTSWAPMAGISRIWTDEPLSEVRPHMVYTGARNGLLPAGFIPYVWNIGERLRRAQVAAELREARQRALEAIMQQPDTDTDPRAVAAAAERYGLKL